MRVVNENMQHLSLARLKEQTTLNKTTMIIMIIMIDTATNRYRVIQSGFAYDKLVKADWCLGKHARILPHGQVDNFYSRYGWQTKRTEIYVLRTTHDVCQPPLWWPLYPFLTQE
jgi:hypothetical protein